MRKTLTILSVFFAALLLFVFTPVKTKATTYTIQVADNFFNPAIQSANVGDTILFQWVGPSRPHTATSTSVPLGAATFDEPINDGSTTFTYVLTTAGNYDYQCNFHGGMIGSLSVSAGGPTTYEWNRTDSGFSGSNKLDS